MYYKKRCLINGVQYKRVKNYFDKYENQIVHDLKNLKNKYLKLEIVI